MFSKKIKKILAVFCLSLVLVVSFNSMNAFAIIGGPYQDDGNGGGRYDGGNSNNSGGDCGSIYNGNENAWVGP